MFLAYFFDEIRITDISLVFLMNFLGVIHTCIKRQRQMNFLVCRVVVMAYLVEQTAKRKRRNKGDFLAPFSTIQLKKKRTIITTRFFLNAHIKTTKQHLHPIPFLATTLFF